VTETDPAPAPDPGPTPDPAPAPETVFFLSDYGSRDEFVGVVHAVLRRLAPHAVVIDITHDIAPFDVRAGAAALARAAPFLGTGVVLAVVDPGVGGPRRGVVVEVSTPTGPRWFVGPDNGLLLPAALVTGVLARVVAIGGHGLPGAPLGPPATFDGRDVFAPAVAALCRGADPGALGVDVELSSLRTVPDPVVEVDVLGDGRWRVRAEVTWVDRFGNVQLAAGGDLVPAPVSAVTVGAGAHTGSVRTRGSRRPAARHPNPSTAPVRRVRAFADLAPGEPGLLVDANGRLALVVREGSAAALFAVAVGSLIELAW